MASKDKTVTVPHRIYSERDERGRARLLHAAGSKVDWDTAVGLGLVEGRQLPEDQRPFEVLFDVFEGDEPGRRLVHRAGRVITVAEARKFGLLDSKENPADDETSRPDADKGAADATGKGTADTAPESGADADQAPGSSRGGRRKPQEG